MQTFWKVSARIWASLALLSTSGCMTHALWSGELAESFHEPSSPNQMALYETPDRCEVLVQYDELSPWKGSAQRRAYLMRENSARIESRKKPRFVALTAANGLSAIPLYCERSAPSGVGNLSGTYAITLTNDNQFTIVCTNGPAQGHFELPTYRGATGNLKLALLTPVTLVLDASIVGGVAGYWCLAAAAASGNQCLYSTGL